jgi:hypothetical protein
MRRVMLAVTMALSTASLCAQYGAPARDLRDAVRMLQEVQRLIDPAIAAAHDEAAVLNMLAKAGEQLKDAQPMSSFDDASKVIDEFVDKRSGRDDPGLARDMRASIDAARRILAESRPPMNVALARERLHHEVIHPLQRQVLRNAGELEELAAACQFMSQRYLTRPLPEAIAAATYASVDPPK